MALLTASRFSSWVGFAFVVAFGFEIIKSPLLPLFLCVEGLCLWFSFAFFALIRG